MQYIGIMHAHASVVRLLLMSTNNGKTFNVFHLNFCKLPIYTYLLIATTQ